MVVRPINLFIFWLVAVLLVNGNKQFPIWPLRMKKDAGLLDDQRNLQGRIEKGYYVEVLIGTPQQTLNILIDTGSSNFAVASKKHEFVSKYYEAEKSMSVVDMGIADVDIEYTEGFWKGHLVTDIITIPSANLTRPTRVSIVKITDSKQFFINESGWQGILGMAYSELVRPNDGMVKSFMQSIVEDTGSGDIFSLKLCMADVRNFSDSVSGTLTIGGFDNTIGPIYWTKVIREWYYDVLVLGMKVGNFSVLVPCSEFNNDKAIVDSGTTNLHFPRKIFAMIVHEIEQHIVSIVPSGSNYESFWKGNDVLCWDISVDPYVLFPPLTIYLPSAVPSYTIELMVHAEHYILFSESDSVSGQKSCYKFGVSPSDTGTVLGAVLMEEYTVIFDRKNKVVGFGASDCSPTSRMKYTMWYPNTTDCTYGGRSTSSHFQVVVYVLLGVLLLFMLPVCILSYIRCRRRVDGSRVSDADNLLVNPSTSN